MEFENRLKINLKKTKWKNIENWIEYITKEMFSIVGAEDEYTKEFTHKENWFMKHSWTIDQQKEYQLWIMKELRAMKISKKFAIQFAKQFTFNYGWTLKRNEEN